MRFNLKKILKATVAFSLVVASLVHCDILGGGDDGGDDQGLALAALALSQSSNSACISSEATTVSADISSDTTWSGCIILSGIRFVNSGVTLTVAAGTQVFGQTGSALFILSGATITASGSSSSPIVFTSSQTTGSRSPGDWGGLVVIGAGTTTRVSTTEGGQNISYGNLTGNNADNSGTLNYVRIEFAGNEVSTGDELNALSSYAVGSGTTYTYLQAHRGLDDSFEFWGGAVNMKYALATGGKDDDIDLDEGYVGKMQFIISHKYAESCGGTSSSDPHGMEMDGSHGSGTAPSNGVYTNPNIANFTLIGADISGGFGMRLREGMQGSFTHGLIYNFNSGNYRCDTNTGGGSETAPTIANVLAQTGKTNTATCTTTNISVTETLSALPITSEGTVDSTSNCAYTANPDYATLSSLSAAPTLSGVSGFSDSFFTSNATYGAYDGSTKWWDSWTTYDAK
ncbi:MAG: hypothetical protein AAF518_22530 [Spirochaetota bacterium]